MEIKKAYSSDFKNIFPLLQDFHNLNISRDEWQKLFTDRYPNDLHFYGYYINHNDLPTGFLGLIFAKRKIGDKDYNFANMTAWIVKPESRSHSLKLMFEALSIPNTIFTNLTPNPNLWDLLSRFGFVTVDNYFLIKLPWFHLNLFKGIKLIDNLEILKKEILPVLEKLIDDHMESNCKPYLFIKGVDRCLIFANRIYKKKYPFSQVLYVSDKSFFTKNMGIIANKICRRQKTIALYTGEHFVKGKPAISFKYNRKTFFKGEGISSAEIDFLYSELA